MYASALRTSMELLQRVQNGCTAVRNTPDIFQLIRQLMQYLANLVWQYKANI
jgi:hypothetical protein